MVTILHHTWKVWLQGSEVSSSEVLLVLFTSDSLPEDRRVRFLETESPNHWILILYIGDHYRNNCKSNMNSSPPSFVIIAQNKTHGFWECDKNTWEVDNLTILDLSSWLREREAGEEEEKEEQEAEAA